MDNLADAWRTWRGQDQAGSGVGAGGRAWHGPLCQRTVAADRIGWRNRARRARGHDRRSGRASTHFTPQRASAMGRITTPARMAEWRGRLRIFGGGPRAAPRSAIRCCLVRRAREMALRRCHLRHVAILAAARTEAASAHHHHAAPDPVDQAAPRRSANTAVTRAATHANAAHLSPAFLAEVLARYAGTRIGRREIDGEIIEDRADALWTRAVIEASRFAAAPPLVRIVIGIDPPGSSRPGADACGIVAAGIAEDGRIYVLEDA